MENTYLMHYGVKGMKWGVRKSPEHSEHKQRMKSIKKEEQAVNQELVKAYRKANRAVSENVKRDRKASLSETKGVLARHKVWTQSYEARNKGWNYNENMLDIGHYEITKHYQQRKYSEIMRMYGPDSRQAKRAKRLVDSNIVSWRNAMIRKDPESGKYNITRIYVVY